MTHPHLRILDIYPLSGSIYESISMALDTHNKACNIDAFILKRKGHVLAQILLISLIIILASYVNRKAVLLAYERRQKPSLLPSYRHTIRAPPDDNNHPNCCI